jgi:hypothetical protein
MSDDYQRWQDQVFDEIDLRRRLAEVHEKNAALASEATALGLDFDKLMTLCVQQQKSGISLSPEELIRFVVERRKTKDSQ